MVDRGILLSYIKYGDNDAILHCFTENAGFQSFFMRGIYSPKNKKKSYLTPMTELYFTISDFHKKYNIQTISKIEKVKTLENYEDIRVSSILFFVAEFLHQVLKTELVNTQIYTNIKVFLHQLENQNYQAHYAFLVEYLRSQGVAPLCREEKFLDPESGFFSESICHHLFDEQVSEYWKKMISNEEIYDVKIKNSMKEDFLDSVLVYYSCHFPEFKIPKSLDVLRQIFSE